MSSVGEGQENSIDQLIVERTQTMSGNLTNSGRGMTIGMLVVRCCIMGPSIGIWIPLKEYPYSKISILQYPWNMPEVDSFIVQGFPG
jgi:hypothetical protein